MVTLSALWDLKKCYEHVVHATLGAKAAVNLFPVVILRISLRSYRWPRRISRDGAVSRAIFPTRGIIAGSVSANYELKCYLLDVLQAHVRAHPLVNVSFFVDDGAQDVSAPTAYDAASLLVESALNLRQALEHQLELPLAEKKCLLLGSSRRAVDLAGAWLGQLGAARRLWREGFRCRFLLWQASREG